MPKRNQPPSSKLNYRADPPPDISPRWLLTAFALTLLAAALCGYTALCLLFYQGQWQLLFHPSRTITTTPAKVSLAFEEIHFDVTDAGQPQIDGWYIPADPQAQYVTATVLYLHDARGSLSDYVPALQLLHATGINIFAFDYRGFGRSAGAHPTEHRATDDATAAWTYLTDTRHLSPNRLIVYGDGAGATFAAHLAAQFAPAGAILEDPSPTARQILLSDARARILPLWLLQKERLDPTADLAHAHTPRLFLDVRREPDTPAVVGGVVGYPPRTRALFNASSYPKQYYDLRALPASALATTLTRFYDDVLH
ncbi:MAG: alpha/beta hydrolase [Acidobacteriaceae bacterium]